MTQYHRDEFHGRIHPTLRIGGGLSFQVNYTNHYSVLYSRWCQLVESGTHAFGCSRLVASNAVVGLLLVAVLETKICHPSQNGGFIDYRKLVIR